MTIRAKFSGKCTVCGGSIRTGEEVEWSREDGARHPDCALKLRNAGPIYEISCGQGYGGRSYVLGEVLRNKRPDEPDFLTVISSRDIYVREEGMSFGVGDDQGYIYTAICREATPEEIAPVLEAEKIRAARLAARHRLNEIAELIKSTGERPDGNHTTEGKVYDLSEHGVKLYGGGQWFVIGTDLIWYVKNNGGDGDCWSRNNVASGSAIGWHAPFCRELADEIKVNHSIFRPRG